MGDLKTFIQKLRRTPTFQGWVGVKPDRTIVGWVADLDRLDGAVIIQVVVNDWTSTPLIANEYRHHLKLRKFGTARYGYTVRVPEKIQVSKDDQIRILVVDHLEQEIGKLPNIAKITPEFFVKSEKIIPQAALSVQDALKIVSQGASAQRSKLKSIDMLVPFANEIVRDPGLASLLRECGRSLIKSDPDGALKLLNAANNLNPEDTDTIFRLGVAHARSGDNDEALSFFRALFSKEECSASMLSEHAQALRRVLEQNGHQPNPRIVEELKTVVQARLSLGVKKDGLLPPSVARTLSRFGFFDLALQALESMIQGRPDYKDAYTTKARTLIESRRVEEGLEVVEAVLARWPDDEAALHIKRVFRGMRGDAKRSSRVLWLDLSSTPVVLRDGDGTLVADPSDPENITAALSFSEPNWIVIDKSSSRMSETALLLTANASASAGCLKPAPSVTLWKASAVRDLLAADLLSTEAISADLGRMEPHYIRPHTKKEIGTVVLMSRWGAVKYGGAEHFLQSAAQHYLGLGYKPLILGFKKVAFSKGIQAMSDQVGLRYDFIDDDPLALRRLLIQENVTLIHAISGAGFLAAKALGEMNIPFIYGVHYFREVLGGDGSEIYFDQNGNPIPRDDFSFVVSRASAIYANSHFTQKLLEKAHGIRCPIVFSVPEDQSS